MRKAMFVSVIVLVAAAGVFAEPSQVREVPFPYKTIQEAIDAANDGDTVVVHPGTFFGYGNRDIDFLGKAITVRSEDPEEAGIVAGTIIDCKGTAGDPHRAFIFQTMEDANSILDGFTIINGYMRVDGNDAPGADSNGVDGGDSVGGGISCIGSSPIIRNCIINNCIAEGGAGGKGTDGDPGVPPDPNDPNDTGVDPTPGTGGGNGGSGYGGGIYCDPNSGPTILNCQFNQCTAVQGSAGAGGAEGGAGGVSDANGWGGGICVDTGSTASVTDCTFFDCNAVGGENKGFGGGIYYGMGYSGALVADMTACVSGYGGGVYCDGDGDLTISGSSITGSSADYGAAIYCDVNCVLELNDCNLTNGSAKYGAGLCCAPLCTVTARGVKILDNTVTDDGGGIFFAFNGTLTLSNCNIVNNLATGSGGGIFYDTGGTLMLAGCSILNNSCGDGTGGGIFAGNLTSQLGATVIAGNCTISNNTALYGAGICLVETTATINDCTINGNTAEYGGGAYWYVSDVNISNCTISNNVAARKTYCSGGGLYCLNSTERIEDCVIQGNYAQGFGGGVYVIGPNLPGGAQEMTNCLVTLNSAGLDGAGLSFNVDAAPVMSNCTIASNFVTDPQGSGGGVSCYDAFAEITDSILYNNVAGYGPEIAVGDPLEISNPPAGVEVTYSDVLGGEELVHVSTGCTLNWDANNLDTDPLFTSGYYLSNTEAGDDIDSPCVDAGSDTSEAKGLNRYTTRADFAPDEDIVDMGYHYALQRILCDCDFDGNVDISDLTIMFSYWLEGLCELSYGCEGADADLDNDVDLVDFATCANVYAPVDEAPPTPNPSLWETEPGTYPELPGSVLMRAATSTDQNGVEYRFVCTGGGCRNSGWQNTVLYVDKNLPPGTYTYKCQARDKSPQQNRTAWSEEVSATLVIVK